MRNGEREQREREKEREEKKDAGFIFLFKKERPYKSKHKTAKEEKREDATT